MYKTAHFARHIRVASPYGAMQSMSKIIPDDFVTTFRLATIALIEFIEVPFKGI